ncbi:hypothetical protein FACS1894176_10110 [Bacteroidia bacterium]|nr:hypothetical protein FACS1894176_10110 [Bacteroidia bacterium]
MAQDTSVVVFKITTNTSKSISTTEKDWSWENNQWLYKGEPTEIFPTFYTETEDTEETIVLKNGKTQKRCYRSYIEVRMQYDTEIPDWKWNGKKWEYQGNEVESFPPHYNTKQTKNKTESDICN